MFNFWTYIGYLHTTCTTPLKYCTVWYCCIIKTWLSILRTRKLNDIKDRIWFSQHFQLTKLKLSSVQMNQLLIDRFGVFCAFHSYLLGCKLMRVSMLKHEWFGPVQPTKEEKTNCWLSNGQTNLNQAPGQCQCPSKVGKYLDSLVRLHNLIHRNSLFSEDVFQELCILLIVFYETIFLDFIEQHQNKTFSQSSLSSHILFIQSDQSTIQITNNKHL